MTPLSHAASMLGSMLANFALGENRPKIKTEGVSENISDKRFSRLASHSRIFRLAVVNWKSGKTKKGAQGQVHPLADTRGK